MLVDRVGPSETASKDTLDTSSEPSAAESSSDLVGAGLQRGATISRYVLLGLIGRGGMGEVWKAYDPDLDRNVAIKFMLPGFGEHGRVRMQREARALAKLNHPNVVVALDFGVLDDRIWVAMALIQGVTLSNWLGSAQRSPMEIVEVFLQAGRGLAAAHVEGVTHRDFKPANVMVGNDGIVRVMDFGLARTGSDQAIAAEIDRSADGTDPDADSLADTAIQFGTGGSTSELTQAGTVLGTPPYLAPEQARGETADARSDQFSFCTSLYEALYGVRLFAGRALDRHYEVADRDPLPGSPPPGLPGEVRNVVLRGLRLDPSGRYPDMDSLLSDLRRALEPKRKPRIWPALGIVSLLTGVGAIAWLSAGERETCESDSSTLAEAWNSSIAQELRAAAIGSNLSYAATTWAKAERDLDDWARRWARAQQRACEATKIEKKQSQAMLERRNACLDLQLIRVESIVAGLRRLEDSPRELLDRASELSLPDLDRCEAVHLLDAAILVASDEATAAEATAIRETLAAAEGLADVGEYQQALALAEQALARASELDFEPVTAEAQLLVGMALDRLQADAERAQSLLREAAWSAQRSGHEVVIVRTAAALAKVSSEHAKLDVAAIWSGFARAALERLGDAPDVEFEVRRSLGTVAAVAGEFEAAIVEYRRALELAEQRSGENSHDYIVSLHSIGDLQRELGRYEEASETLGRARQLASETLGAKHPMVAIVLGALATTEAARGQLDLARELHLAALAINEEVFGKEHTRVARDLHNLSIIHDEFGHYAEAMEALLRARAILSKELGAEHPDVGFVDVNLGVALQNLGRHDEALARFESALAVLDKSLGPDHMAVGAAWGSVGNARLALGDPTGALAAFERASTVLGQAFGDTHPMLASVEHSRARALLTLDRTDEALAASTRALQMGERIFGAEHAELVAVLSTMSEIELRLARPGRAVELGERGLALASDANSPAERAAIRFALAQALAADAGPEELARARVLGREALELLADAEGDKQLRGDIEGWLAGLGD